MEPGALPARARRARAHLSTRLSPDSSDRARAAPQYFDDHVAFFVPSLTSTVAALLRDGVPFFVTQSDGLYESVYVELPATGKVVEVLGDFVLGSPLPPTHVRLSSTQQFCTPKRRRDRRRRLGADRPAGRDSPFAWDTFGPVYAAGDADGNKTTIAGADPDAAVDFAVAYLGASRVEQKRGPEGDGDCAKLAWAQFRADAHQWHVVDARRADWVTRGGGEPGVPYNISQLAACVFGERALRARAARALRFPLPGAQARSRAPGTSRACATSTRACTTSTSTTATCSPCPTSRRSRRCCATTPCRSACGRARGRGRARCSSTCRATASPSRSARRRGAIGSATRAPRARSICAPPTRRARAAQAGPISRSRSGARRPGAALC